MSFRRLVMVVLTMVLVGLSLPVAGRAQTFVASDGNRRLGAADRPVRGRDIPGLAVDPTNPDHVVEVEEEFITGQCAYHVTFDGGRTWTGGNLKAPQGYPDPPCPVFDSGGYSHSNGAVVFGAGQDVYTAFTSAKPGAGDSILVAKSTDGGRTFGTATVAIPGAATQQESVTFRPKIGAKGDRITVVARVCDALLVPGAAGACYLARTASTSDGGATWRAPVRLDAPTDTTATVGNHFSQPVYTPDGKIHVVYTRPAEAPRANLVLATSSDDGRSWAYSEVGFVRSVTEPKLLADPADGTLFLAYQVLTAAGGSDTDIGFRKRPAGTAAWTPQVRVNDDGPGFVQRFPDLSRAPNGRLDILWRDRRHPYPHPALRGMEDFYLASSSDGGATWSANQRVTDRSINLDVGLDRRVGSSTFYWPAVASLGTDRILAAWGDSREGDFNDDTSDVYTAVVDLGASGPARTTLDASPETPVALSRLAYPGGLEAVGTSAGSVVVIVNEDDVSAAIPAAALARFGFGPLLTASVAGLSAPVAAEVDRMQPVQVLLVGSEAALPEKVVEDLLAAGVSRDKVVRVTGSDPAAIARAVATRMDTRSDADKARAVAAFPAAVIVNAGSPFAAAATAMSAALRLPVLLVDRESIPSATAEALRSLAVPRTFVIGGPAAVGDPVLAKLPAPKRLGADDLASVSEAVVRESRALGLPLNQAFVGDIDRPVESAVVGAAVARVGGLMVLTPEAGVSTADQVLDRAEVSGSVQRTIRVVASASRSPSGVRTPQTGQLPATGASAGGIGLILLLAAGLVRRSSLAGRGR